MGVMPISCPHFKITIVKRSQGQSAVAGAAYQSGERLFSEYDQKTKFYNKKKELVHSEIMLPPHAPPGYADRATLWNAVESVENQWNSQLARRIVLALPREVPKDQYLPMLKEELDAFNKAVRTLMKLNGGTTVDFSALDAEFSALQSGSAELRSQLETLQPDLTALKNVRKYIDLVLNKQQLSAPGGKTPEKESVLKQLEQLQQEKSKHKAITAMNREESL